MQYEWTRKENSYSTKDEKVHYFTRHIEKTPIIFELLNPRTKGRITAEKKGKKWRVKVSGNEKNQASLTQLRFFYQKMSRALKTHQLNHDNELVREFQNAIKKEAEIARKKLQIGTIKTTWKDAFREGAFKVRRASFKQLDFFTHFKNGEVEQFSVSNANTGNTLRVRKIFDRWKLELVANNGNISLPHEKQQEFFRKKMLEALKTHPYNEGMNLSGIIKHVFKKS